MGLHGFGLCLETVKALGFCHDYFDLDNLDDIGDLNDLDVAVAACVVHRSW